MFNTTRYMCMAISASTTSTLILAACAGNGDARDPGPDAHETTSTIQHRAEPPNLVPGDLHGGKNWIYNAILMPIVFPNGDGELDSHVLDSWELSDDTETVKLSIHPNVAWSDGTPITSADIAMSLSYYLDPTLSLPASDQLGKIAGQSNFDSDKTDTISGISILDESTIVIDFGTSDPAWMTKLAWTETLPVLPAHILGNVQHDEFEDHSYFETFPVANGPYGFVDWVQGQYIELERNTRWSLGEAGFDRLFWKFVDPGVAPAQLEAGEIDFISGVDPVEADRLASLDGISTLSLPRGDHLQWVFNHIAPLTDRRVRQAMMYAIDRQAVCEVTYMTCNDTVPTTNIPLIGNDWALPTMGVKEYNYDPERARQLLDDADWDQSTELVFLDTAPIGSPTSRALEIAREQMAEVGINWTFESVERAAFFERLEQAPDSFHGIPAEGLVVSADPDNARTLLSCQTWWPNGTNFGRYCNERLDTLLESGGRASDPDERAEIYKEAFRIVSKDVPAIYMFEPTGQFAYDADLAGIGSPAARSFYSEIGEWHWSD